MAQIEKKTCPNCKGEYIIKHGWKLTRQGKKQQYQCKTCGFIFSEWNKPKISVTSQ